MSTPWSAGCCRSGGPPASCPPGRSPASRWPRCRTSTPSADAGGVSHDAAAGLAPVAVPEGLFVELAGREPGELAGEVDRPGAFEVGEVLTAERDQLRGGVRSGVGAGHELDDGFDFLAEVFVGDAEDRGVGDLGV